MEESSSQQSKLVWDGDAKAVQQCLTDIFTSVYTTCDIPESAIFGPCVLSHTSLYDSIAFIALKATDKRTAPYIFRVDTSATNSTSEGLMWLRLVQSSRDRQEQNLEAYVKSGQLFYRSLRRIQKDEELLVWYGKELVELLLLTSGGPRGAVVTGPSGGPRPAVTGPSGARPAVTAAVAAAAAGKTKGSPSPHSCPDCSQRFQFEFPFLAHLRFRCTKRLQQSLAGAEEEPAGKGDSRSSGGTPTRSSPKLGRSEGFLPPGGGQDTNKPSMDFHNLARDLENNSSSSPRSDKEAEIRSESLGKRKFSEAEEEPREPPRVPGLPPAATTKSKDELASSAQNYRGAYGLEEKRRAFSPPRPPPMSEPGEAKRSAFTEVKKSGQSGSNNKQHGAGKTLQSANSENKEAGRGPGSSEKHLNIRQVLSETQPLQGSAFTSVGQGKSAFSQPSRLSFSQMAGPLVMPGKLLDCHPSVGDALSSSRLYQADHLAAKLHAAELGAKQSPFVYAAAAATAGFWPNKGGVVQASVPAIQLQVPSALTLLPPSFTSLCLPAQNWCAKCNASFRMTSDLVYHMRSHHKKEFNAMEPLVKRRREEKLKCPICNESFRERHHLSRHMTSHN